MSEANGITAEKVLELLRAWSTPGRWKTSWKQLERWRKHRDSASQLHASAFSAPQRAGNFPDVDMNAYVARLRREAEDDDQRAEGLHAIFIASVNERSEIENWVRTNGLFDIAAELPVLQIQGVKPSDDAIRDAAQRMQRVLFMVERHLAEPAAETTKVERISSDTKSVRSWPPIPADHEWGGLFSMLRKEYPTQKNMRAICKEFIEGKRGKTLAAAEKAAGRNKHFWHPGHASDK